MTLLLFHETKEEQLEREMKELRESVGKVRRGMFARHSELERKYQETYWELEQLKASIAKQDVTIWSSRASNPSLTKRKNQVHSPDLFTFQHGVFDAAEAKLYQEPEACFVG